MVAPITMAAAPADPAGGVGFGVAALPTRTTTAEVRFCHRPPRSLWHFPPCAPTPTANRHFGQIANILTPGRGWGAGGGRGRAIPMFPPIVPRLASANNRAPTAVRAPTSTGVFLGVRDHAWIIVTARLRSSSQAFTPLHPKQAHGDTGGILTPKLIRSQPR